MGTVPAFPTITTGSTPTGATFAAMKAAHDFLLGPPKCHAYRDATQNFATGTWGIVYLNAEMIDVVQSGDAGMHDPSASNSRIYIRTPGIYRITGQLYYSPQPSGATGARLAQVRVNANANDAAGVQIVQTGQGPISGSSTAVPISAPPVRLLTGDYIEMFGLQSSGSTLTTAAGSGLTFLAAEWIAA